MATFRGMDGSVSLGGVVSTGSPLTQGAVAQSATAATFDGGGSNLRGILAAGDTFTVAGDAQVYTIVTGGAIGSSTPNELAVTFTPAVVPGGGWADNAAVTFVTNVILATKEWTADVVRDRLDGSVQGSASKTYVLARQEFSGRCRGLFDYGDLVQAQFIDEALSTNDTSLGLTLVVDTDKVFYGLCKAGEFAVVAQDGDLVTYEFQFTSNGAIAVDWT